MMRGIRDQGLGIREKIVLHFGLPADAGSSTLALFISLLLLASCGFQPLHSKAMREQFLIPLESVEIITDPNHYPQLLKAEIEDNVNPQAFHAEKLYTLKVSYSEVETSLFINTDGTSSRGDMLLQSTYQLSRKLDGKLLDSGSITRVSSYNISENADYATFVSREDARKRGIKELAQDYKLRMANLLPKMNDPEAAATKRPDLSRNAPIIPAGDTHEARPQGF